MSSSTIARTSDGVKSPASTAPAASTRIDGVASRREPGDDHTPEPIGPGDGPGAARSRDEPAVDDLELPAGGQVVDQLAEEQRVAGGDATSSATSSSVPAVDDKAQPVDHERGGIGGRSPSRCR